MSAIDQTFRVVTILLVSMSAVALAGCKREAASTPVRPVPEVSVVTVSLQTVPDEPEFIGQTEASWIR